MARKSAIKKKRWLNSKLTKAQQEAFNKFPLVHVAWRDAFTPGGTWQFPEDYDSFVKSDKNLISEVGHLIEANDEFIVLASRVTHDGIPGQVIKIPKTWCSITRIRYEK